MGVLAIQYQSSADSPLLVALNREEKIDRKATVPRIQSGRPRMVCGIDTETGGTWAGVNQCGLFVAVINAPKRSEPLEPRSRGLLCKDLLSMFSVEEAVEHAVKELESGVYAGCNFLCADQTSGFAIHGGDDIYTQKLRPGLHVLSENPLDDVRDARQEYARRQLTLQRIDSAVSFFAIASRTFARPANAAGKLGLIVRKGKLATVSSILLSLTEKSPRSVMQYADGSPDVRVYEDVSALLRQVLSTDKAAKAAAAAKEAKKNLPPEESPDTNKIGE
ncbi:hypothetical protein FACS189454_03580 [Planctomycetales bacterium]|nr:hypothetical protein FACS189454_03580 [Planctomycetales bacterium]